MGVSVIGYCKNMTDEMEDNQPGFWNDCRAWGNWMAEREDHPEVRKILKELECEALLSHSTDGMTDYEVEWVAPLRLKEAALKLRKLVLENNAQIKPILDSYGISANGIAPVNEEFARDLSDVAEIAEFFQNNQKMEMTLEVNW